ncbi:MAG: hypothetical protein R6V73_14025 [Anaerolineales bacterium]
MEGNCTCWTTGQPAAHHRPTDNLERVVMARLPEGIEILTCLLRRYDQR